MRDKWRGRIYHVTREKTERASISGRRGGHKHIRNSRCSREPRQKSRQKVRKKGDEAYVMSGSWSLPVILSIDDLPEACLLPSPHSPLFRSRSPPLSPPLHSTPFVSSPLYLLSLIHQLYVIYLSLLKQRGAHQRVSTP